MSEFTVGTLFLSRDRAAVLTALHEAALVHITKDLNATWSVFLTPDEWLFLPETQAAVRQISEAAPLLHFSGSEDHGWSFRLFYGGHERAAFSEHYPWDPLIDLLIGEEDPHDPPAVPGPEQLVYFRLFALAPEQVDALGALLAEPSPQAAAPASRASRFLRLLGAEQFEGINHRMITREGATG